MYATPNTYAEPAGAGMEAMIEFAHAQLAALECLSALNFNVARSAFGDTNRYAQALLATKDAPELARLSAALALPALDRSIAYSLSVCEIGSQVQGEMARLADAQAAEFNTRISIGLDKLMKYVPVDSSVTVKAAKSALQTASSALGSLAEFGIKTSELAQSKFAAAASSVSDADARRGKTNAKIGKDNSQPGKDTRRKAP